MKFHFKKQIWVYKLAKIEGLHCTHNVVDLLVGEMKKLEKPTRKLLEAASAIAEQFHVDLLCEITNIQQTKLLPMLSEALQHGFIQPKYIAGDNTSSSLTTLSGGSLSGSTCSTSSNETTSNPSFSGLLSGSNSFPTTGALVSTFGTNIFCFHHTQIHKGFYQCLTRGRRRAFHYQIGKILIHRLRSAEKETVSESKVQRNIDNDNENAHANQETEFYNIIHHLVIGQDLIPTIEESLEFFDVFYEGAVQARTLGNLELALFYIEKAQNLFFDWYDEHSSWDDEYMRTFNLLKASIEIKAICPAAKPVEDFELMFRNVHNKSHKLEFHTVQAKYLASTMQYAQIKELVLSVLQEFGFSPSDSENSLASVGDLVSEMKAHLHQEPRSDISTLCKLPKSEDTLNELILSFIAEILMPLYLADEIPLFCAVVVFANSLT